MLTFPLPKMPPRTIRCTFAGLIDAAVEKRQQQPDHWSKLFFMNSGFPDQAVF